MVKFILEIRGKGYYAMPQHSIQTIPETEQIIIFILILILTGYIAIRVQKNLKHRKK